MSLYGGYIKSSQLYPCNFFRIFKAVCGLVACIILFMGFWKGIVHFDLLKAEHTFNVDKFYELYKLNEAFTKI